MATRSQIEKCISNAVSAFNAIIPNGNSITEGVEFVIAGSGGYAECLNKTVERLCATEKEFDSLTTAEVVIGSKGKAVVIYSRRFPEGLPGELVIAHELGHILDTATNAELSTALKIAIAFQTENPFVIGGAFWSEFIAQVVANYIYQDRDYTMGAYTYLRDITQLLDLAIHGKTMDVPSLGLYFGKLLSDAESLALMDKDEPPMVGMSHCSEQEIHALLDISDVLIRQIEEVQPFWQVSEERLIEIGRLINALYYVTDLGKNTVYRGV